MYPALFRFTFLQMVIFSQPTTNSVKKLGAGTSAVGFGAALSSSQLKLRWHLCFSRYTHCTECKRLLGRERETTLLRQLQEVMSNTVCTEDRTSVPTYYQRQRSDCIIWRQRGKEASSVGVFRPTNFWLRGCGGSRDMV